MCAIAYTPCLKKNCADLFFAPCVSYEPISIKIGRIIQEETSTKLWVKCPLHLKYVLALPWEN